MLPSVPAPFVTLQADPRQASPARAEATALVQHMAPTPTNATHTTAGTTSSLELLQLSGQLRLGESLSVFAETLGSLLKLPRHEGEALADYSKRLAAAINVLSTAERATLQAQLNQIMQGATLRLLAEMLKDPSGPVAARLAAQIEIAQFQESDLATGHAVSSYRQNNSSDAGYAAANANVANARARDAGPADKVAVAGPGGGISEAPVRPPGDAGSHSHVTAGNSGKNAASAEIVTESGSTGFVASDSNVATGSIPRKGPQAIDTAQQHTENRAPSNNAGGQPIEPGTLQGNDAHLPETASDTAVGADAGFKIRRTAQSKGNTGTTTAAGADTDGQGLTRSDTMPKASATIYDAAALARRAHGNNGLLCPLLPEVTVDQFANEWVSDMPTGKPNVRDLRQHVLGTQNTITSTMAEAAPVTIVTEGEEAAKPSPHAAREAADETVITPPTGQPMPATTLPTTPLAQQTDAAFEKALLGMMLPPREPTAYPLVPNAGAQEFDDGEDHEIKRKPAVGDDEQPSRQGFGGQQFSGDQKQQSSQDNAEAEALLSPIEAEAPQEPDMAPARPGLREAPTQHLSNDPAGHSAPGAEDFYRRMAILE